MERSCTARPFGSDCTLFTLKNGELQVQVTNYGATLVSVQTPDRDGKLENIVLGFDTIEQYQASHPYFGAIVGPCANRIGHASFVLDGFETKLQPNDGYNLLHGGEAGVSRQKWHGERRSNDDSPAVVMTLATEKGVGKFPGSLLVTVTYKLEEDGLLIEYRADTDAPTVCNFTSHPYWNLLGAGIGNILDHILEICADCYTPADESLIPTGQILGVRETGLNFSAPRMIRASMFARETMPGGGYDHNFVLRGGINGAMGKAAVLRERTTGRQVEIYTTQPGLQLYTGNGLDGSLSGAKGPFVKHGGVCLEAQHYPDAPNHEFFPSVILRPSDAYHHYTKHVFSVVS